MIVFPSLLRRTSLAIFLTAALTVTAAAATSTDTPPTTVKAVKGTIEAGTVDSLAADDDDYLSVRASRGVVLLRATFASIPNETTSLTVTHTASSTPYACTYFLSIYSWTAKAWEQLFAGATPPPGIEGTIKATPAGPPANYVSGSSGPGEVRVRTKCRRTNLPHDFTLHNDRLTLQYTTD